MPKITALRPHETDGFHRTWVDTALRPFLNCVPSVRATQESYVVTSADSLRSTCSRSIRRPKGATEIQHVSQKVYLDFNPPVDRVVPWIG
jgi:hypothetical protein